MKNSTRRIELCLLAVAGWLLVASGLAIGGGQGQINVAVKCHCTDSVGQNFCESFKAKLQDSSQYQLVDSTANGYGIGVHFSCVDMWHGIDDKLSGRMSAVAAAFTLYSGSLPGEVYEGSDVFRVGKNAVDQMASEIVPALDQIVKVNAPFFKQMRAAAQQAPQSGP